MLRYGCAIRLASRRPSIGRLVFGLVVRMTVHAGAKATQGPDSDSFDQGSGSGTYDESQFVNRRPNLTPHRRPILTPSCGGV